MAKNQLIDPLFITGDAAPNTGFCKSHSLTEIKLLEGSLFVLILKPTENAR